ncbi:MAG: SMI1/KNR4 family protein, partial [Okeania sp. SIO3C4]|nr:SMI1/KNR4 family protein [Okeania sp. SIO3C4]
MSALIEALERIRKLHLKHQPLVAEELQPGLTRGQIDELVKNLPFSLPEELYELYQWRNGMKDLIQWQPFICNRSGMYGFLSLEKALETSQREYEQTLVGYADFLPNWLWIFEA